MPQDLTDVKSTLVLVMAWCCEATSHYLIQCWPRGMLPYGVTGPQRVKTEDKADIEMRKHTTCFQTMHNSCILFSVIVWTHCNWDKMADILQTTFSNVLYWMMIFGFGLKFHRSLFLGMQLTKKSALVWVMVWCQAGDKPLCDQMMTNPTRHECVSRPQWVKVYWCHASPWDNV